MIQNLYITGTALQCKPKSLILDILINEQVLSKDFDAIVLCIVTDVFRIQTKTSKPYRQPFLRSKSCSSEIGQFTF